MPEIDLLLDAYLKTHPKKKPSIQRGEEQEIEPKD